MQINIRYGIATLLKNPNVFFQELKEDIQKDFFNKSNLKKYSFIWCAALPKSGSTLIEKILNGLDYVQLNKSFLRKFSYSGLDHPHGISINMVKDLPLKRYTFLKTHSHYEKNYIDIVKSHNAKIIVSTRNLRDMLISNYFYIMENPRSWEHQYIKNLDIKTGLIKSLYLYDKKKVNQTPLEYYLKWMSGWKEYINKNKDILHLKYEDLNLDRELYIKKILNYLNIPIELCTKIQKVIDEDQNNSSLLNKNLKKIGRSISTYDFLSKNKKKTLISQELKAKLNEIIIKKANEFKVDYSIINNEF